MFRVLSLATITTLLPVVCFALPTDSSQPVHIASDAATYNYKTGVDVYEGHVRVDQGTTHIRADRLETKKNNEHQIVEAVAYGGKSVAHFWTLPQEKESEIHAYAVKIRFYPVLANAVLEQKVHVTQGLNSFSGEIVQYNNAEQTITVPASKNGHADIVYNPEKAPEKA